MFIINRAQKTNGRLEMIPFLVLILELCRGCVQGQLSVTAICSLCHTTSVIFLLFSVRIECMQTLQIKSLQINKCIIYT